MSTEIVVPELGESIVEATVGEWRVAEGQAVKVGDVVVELETDKVDVEVGATAAGVLTRILHPVSYTHLRAHETVLDLVCRLLLGKTNNITPHSETVYQYTEHTNYLCLSRSNIIPVYADL
mgnify:CR=1 FL=1